MLFILEHLWYEHRSENFVSALRIGYLISDINSHLGYHENQDPFRYLISKWRLLQDNEIDVYCDTSNRGGDWRFRRFSILWSLSSRTLRMIVQSMIPEAYMYYEL